MKRNEMNKVFTETVAQYIMEGYTIHTNEMGGSQGQIAAIHMVKENDFIVVIMSRLYEFTERTSRDFDSIFDSGIEIAVKRLPMPKYNGDTVWLNKGVTISVRRFYEVRSEYRIRQNDEVITKEAWYTDDYAEFKACKKVQRKRIRGEYETKIVKLAVNGKVMEKVHNTYGCKKAKLADVEVVIRVGEMVKGTGDHRYDRRYSVHCFGKTISL